MKITARASALNAALLLAALAVRGTKNGTVRIVTGKTSVSFTCSAPGIAIKVTADANIDEPGDITVADRLVGLMSCFPSNGTVTLNTTTGGAMIACGNGRYRLPVTPDSPTTLAMTGEVARIKISGGDLLELFAVLPAASTEETRFYLNGVYLNTIDDRLVAVATDGVKLLRNSVAAEAFSDDPRFIVPAKAAMALIKLLKTTRPEVTLRRSGALFAVTGPGFELVSALIDARYPDTECVVPPTSTNIAVCNRAELINALGMIKAVSSTEPTPLVALSWSDGGPLRLCLPRQPGDADDAIPAEARGSIRIALALPQLIAMVGNFTCDRLHLQATDADTPLVLRGDGEKLGVLFSCRDPNP